VKFCFVGASGVPINIFFTWIGYEFLCVGAEGWWRTALASLLGIVVSIFTNFVLNDIWTWGDRNKDVLGFWARLFRFYLVSSVAAGVQFAAAMSLVEAVGLHYLVAQLCGIAVAMILNYVANNFWTFPESDEVSREQ
jgi:putative flippase GtrA